MKALRSKAARQRPLPEARFVAGHDMEPPLERLCFRPPVRWSASAKRYLTHDRGCIRKQLDESDLLIPSGGEFIPTALAWLSAMSPEPAPETRRTAIQQAYKIGHAAARAAVSALSHFDKA